MNIDNNKQQQQIDRNFLIIFSSLLFKLIDSIKLNNKRFKKLNNNSCFNHHYYSINQILLNRIEKLKNFLHWKFWNHIVKTVETNFFLL